MNKDKYLIFSDLHGSLTMMNKIVEIFEQEKCDKIIFLGDLLYHGPRNKIQDDYNPMAVAEIVNKYKERFIFIRGNCDARVDEFVTDIKAKDKVVINRMLFTHGDLLLKKELKSKLFIDAVFYGHTHVFKYEKIGHTNYINLNSAAIPKDNIKSYIILENKNIKRFDFDKNLLFELNI